MIYTTYYAQTDSITEERFEELKQAGFSGGNAQIEKFHLRKLEFQGAGQRKAVAALSVLIRTKRLQPWVIAA